MAIAVDPRATFSYVLECDRELPQEQQTTWELCGLSRSDEEAVIDASFSYDRVTGDVVPRIGSRAGAILRRGLRGVRRFFDANGREVPFEKVNGVVSEDFLNHLPSAVCAELVNAITERGHPSVQEGNS